MFEGLLADVLDSLAGSFIQGLDRQNLNVGIWSGDVVLSELQVHNTSQHLTPPPPPHLSPLLTHDILCFAHFCSLTSVSHCYRS